MGNPISMAVSKAISSKKAVACLWQLSSFHLEEKIHLREDKYILANAVSVGLGQNQIMNEAKKYDAVIIGDIPSNQRNRLLKQCFEQSIRTYIVPKYQMFYCVLL